VVLKVLRWLTRGVSEGAVVATLTRETPGVSESVPGVHLTGNLIQGVSAEAVPQIHLMRNLTPEVSEEESLMVAIRGAKSKLPNPVSAGSMCHVLSGSL
jgi:hypothetical protein